MSVPHPVSHVEMWPYVASAAARSASHAATAVLIVLSSATRGITVGAGVAVGAGVIVGAGEGAQAPSTCVTPQSSIVGLAVGAGDPRETLGLAVRGITVGVGVAVGAGVIVGAGEGAQAPSTCVTQHDVDSHGVPSNASLRLTSSSTHQPRSWLKAEAL